MQWKSVNVKFEINFADEKTFLTLYMKNYNAKKKTPHQIVNKVSTFKRDTSVCQQLRSKAILYTYAHEKVKWLH